MICELKEVSKSYDSRKIIDSFSFEISQGEMVAVTGPSGSGKSTILNMIGLLEKPDEGKLSWHRKYF